MSMNRESQFPMVDWSHPQEATAYLRVFFTNSARYSDQMKVIGDMLEAIQHSPPKALKPMDGDLFVEDGKGGINEMRLVLLSGVVRMAYEGQEYNTPVEIYFPTDYPKSPPLVYVRPTKDMIINNPNPYVDSNGLVFNLDILREWRRNHQSKGITTSNLIDALSAAFTENPPLGHKPVFAKAILPPSGHFSQLGVGVGVGVGVGHTNTQTYTYTGQQPADTLTPTLTPNSSAYGSVIPTHNVQRRPSNEVINVNNINIQRRPSSESLGPGGAAAGGGLGLPPPPPNCVPPSLRRRQSDPNFRTELLIKLKPKLLDACRKAISEISVKYHEEMTRKGQLEQRLAELKDAERKLVSQSQVRDQLILGIKEVDSKQVLLDDEIVKASSLLDRAALADTAKSGAASTGFDADVYTHVNSNSNPNPDVLKPFDAVSAQALGLEAEMNALDESITILTQKLNNNPGAMALNSFCKKISDLSTQLFKKKLFLKKLVSAMHNKQMGRGNATATATASHPNQGFSNQSFSNQGVSGNSYTSNLSRIPGGGGGGGGTERIAISNHDADSYIASQQRFSGGAGDAMYTSGLGQRRAI